MFPIRWHHHQLFNKNADGGGVEVALTYVAACSINSFSFQLFQIKFDQNRLTKFKNFHFLLYISKNRLKQIKNPNLHDSPFGKSSLLLGAESLTILNYILQHMFGVQPIPEKHDPFLFANERIRLSQINQRSQISKKMCSCLNF